MNLVVTRSQDKYRRLCEEESTVPLFSQAWWLDATAGVDAWGAVLVSNGGRVMGALPYMVRRRFGLTWLGQPQLTQALGPWLLPSSAKRAQKLADEKDILGALADGLPTFGLYKQSWHWERTNWLPFYWKGFQQHTRYTYLLDLTQGEDALWSGLQSNIRREIRKASGRFQIRVRPAYDIGELLYLNRQTFERQGKALTFSDKLVYQIEEAASQIGARDTFIAEDEAGALHAGAYIVRDSRSAYYLLGGADPGLRNSGAGSLCLWEAIRGQPSFIKTFDFEGSMLEPVERFFRAFGASQTPYFRIYRTNSTLLRAAMCARDFVRNG